MRTHTKEFKEEIKKFGREIKGKIIYYPSYSLISESADNILTENDLQLISEQSNYDEPIEINEENIYAISIIKNGDLLQSLMKEFDFEAKDELNIGSVVNPHFGLLVNGNYEYLDYGNFVVYSKEFNMDTETWSYVCYDKMLFSMVKYGGIKNTSYPITIKEYINKLCNKVGLEFEDSVFVNQDQLIYEDLYKDKGLTYRDVFDEISKIVAGNLLINDNDKLEVGYINKAVSESGEESGSSIEITDGEEAELINFELEGKTTQENTPTPDNPSPLVSVGYENLLNLVDGTYSDSEITAVVNNGIITLNGTATANSFINIPISNIDLSSSTNYVLSINNSSAIGGSASSIYACVRLRTSSSDDTATDVLFNVTNNSKVINKSSTTSYIYLRIRTGNSLTYDNYVIKPQLELGSTTHSYIPYGKYGIEVKTTGKNLFDKNTSIVTGKTWTSTGTETNLTNCFVQESYIPVIPNTSYTISTTNNYSSTTDFRLMICEYDTNKNFIRRNIGTVSGGITTKYTITTSSTTHYVRLGASTVTIDELQFEKGTQTTYESYQSNTQLYQLDNPLRGIGNYKDKLYIKNGMLYVDRKIGDIVLNGSESWQQWDSQTLTNTILCGTNVIDNISNVGYVGLSNYFVNSSSSIWDTDTVAMQINGGGTNQIRFRINKTIATTSAELKTWLSTHNTEVQYVLNEPYTEELGQVDMPSTYEGITYIDTTDDLEPTMNVTYISEFEEIDEQYLKDTNVAVGKKFGVINSVAVLDTENNLQYLSEDTQSIKENEMTRITITDNLLALNGDTQTIADNILNKLNGLYYYINDFTTTGVCYYDFLDLFNVKARDNTYQCLLLNNEITISQGIEEHIFTEKLEESETSFNEYTTSVMSDKQVSFMINKQQGEISSKVSKGDVVSEINQSAELISIKSNRIEIESDNFALTQDGTIKAVSGEIGGFVIGENQLYGLHKKISVPYTSSDLTNIRNYIMGTGTLTTEQLEFYDYNKDGVVNAVDYIMIYDLIQNSTKEYTIELNSQYVDKMLNIYDENGGTIIKLGVNNSIFSDLQINNKLDFGDYTSGFHTSISDTSDTFIFEFDGTKDFGQIQLNKNIENNTEALITLNGLTGNISCVSLTQTSKEENKKNFEKLTNAKEILNSTDIYKYNFKDEDENAKKSIGFVIGNDFNYSKEITSQNNDGANIYSMVSVLWQVVKEQQEEINKLKEMINNGKY